MDGVGGGGVQGEGGWQEDGLCCTHATTEQYASEALLLFQRKGQETMASHGQQNSAHTRAC
jgi:hypothetical protein